MNDEKDIPQTEQEFKDRLTPEQYKVLSEKGTEAPFSGKLPEPKDGFFRCVACGNPLFKEKYADESKRIKLFNMGYINTWRQKDEAHKFGAILVEQ